MGLNQQISMRRATPADEVKLRAMQARSLVELGAKAYDRETLNAFVRRVGTMDADMLADGTFFVFEIGSRIIACGGWSVDPPSYDMFINAGADNDGAGFATIRSIYVDPEFAGKGLGSTIMDAVEDDIRSSGIIEARLAATLNGLPFYQRLGYRPQKPIRLSLPGGRVFHGVAMRKAIEKARRLAA